MVQTHSTPFQVLFNHGFVDIVVKFVYFAKSLVVSGVLEFAVDFFDHIGGIIVESYPLFLLAYFQQFAIELIVLEKKMIQCIVSLIKLNSFLFSGSIDRCVWCGQNPSVSGSFC